MDSIVSFTAEWCGYCKQLFPHLDALASMVPGHVNVVKVDSTKNPRLASKYQIKVMPTIYFFVGGKEIEYKGMERTAQALLDAYYSNGGQREMTAKRLQAGSDLKALQTGMWIVFSHPPTCEDDSVCKSKLALANALVGPALQLGVQVGLLSISEDFEFSQKMLGALPAATPCFCFSGGSLNWTHVPDDKDDTVDGVLSVAQPFIEAKMARVAHLAERVAMVPASWFGRVHALTEKDFPHHMGMGIPWFFTFTMENSGPAKTVRTLLEKGVEFLDWKALNVGTATIAVESNMHLATKKFGLSSVPAIYFYSPADGLVYSYYDTCRSLKCFMDWIKDGEFRTRNLGARVLPVEPIEVDLTNLQDLGLQVEPVGPLNLHDKVFAQVLDELKRPGLLLLHAGGHCVGCRELRVALEKVAQDMNFTPLFGDVGRFNHFHPVIAATFQMLSGPRIFVIDGDNVHPAHGYNRSEAGMRAFARAYKQTPPCCRAPWRNPPAVEARAEEKKDSFYEAHTRPGEGTRPVRANGEPYAVGEVATVAPVDLQQDMGSGAIMTMFFAPWCGHCKKLHPIFEDLARQAPQGLVVAQMDCTVETTFCESAGVMGYPTIFLFHGKQKAKYEGSRTVPDFLNWYTRVTGFALPDPPSAPLNVVEGQLVTVTDGNVTSFLDLASKEGKPALIMLTAPWCGWCKKLDLEVPGTVNAVGNKGYIVKIDAVASPKCTSTFEVRGYPTLVLVTPEGGRIPYSGERTAAALSQFVLSKTVKREEL